MKEVPCGLGEKTENWVEKQHQHGGVVQRKRFCTIKHQTVRANARARSEHRDTNMQVVEQGLNVKNKSKRNLFSTGDKISVVERRKAQRVRQHIDALCRYYDPKEAKIEAAKSVIWLFIMSHRCEVDGSSERGRGVNIL